MVATTTRRSRSRARRRFAAGCLGVMADQAHYLGNVATMAPDLETFRSTILDRVREIERLARALAKRLGLSDEELDAAGHAQRSAAKVGRRNAER